MSKELASEAQRRASAEARISHEDRHSAPSLTSILRHSTKPAHSGAGLKEALLVPPAVSPAGFESAGMRDAEMCCDLQFHWRS
jgi:hypothetical protein